MYLCMCYVVCYIIHLLCIMLCIHLCILDRTSMYLVYVENDAVYKSTLDGTQPLHQFELNNQEAHIHGKCKSLDNTVFNEAKEKLNKYQFYQRF